jgi:hypothetical protein
MLPYWKPPANISPFRRDTSVCILISPKHLSIPREVFLSPFSRVKLLPLQHSYRISIRLASFVVSVNLSGQYRRQIVFIHLDRLHQ